MLLVAALYRSTLSSETSPNPVTLLRSCSPTLRKKCVALLAGTDSGFGVGKGRQIGALIFVDFHQYICVEFYYETGRKNDHILANFDAHILSFAVILVKPGDVSVCAPRLI